MISCSCDRGSMRRVSHPGTCLRVPPSALLTTASASVSAQAYVAPQPSTHLSSMPSSNLPPAVMSPPRYGALDTSLKHAKQQSAACGDERAEIWRVPLSRSFNDCSLVREVGLLAGIDAHRRCFSPGQGFRIEFNKAAVDRK